MSYPSMEGKQQGAACRLWPNRPEVRSAQKVRVKSDGSRVEIANVKMSMNPFDEIAIEVAVRLREEGVVIEWIALSSMPTRTPAVEILAGVCGYDVPRIKTFGTCFTSVVYPGDTVETEIGVDDDIASFRCLVRERDAAVLDHGQSRIAVA